MTARPTTRCSKCGAKKVGSEKLVQHGWCRKCSRENRRRQYWKNPQAMRAQMYRANRIRLLEYTSRIRKLKQAPCKDCGRRFPSMVMDFDHRDSSKKVACVSRLVNRVVPWAKILAEIKKCDLICSNCHRIRTWVTRRRKK